MKYGVALDHNKNVIIRDLHDPEGCMCITHWIKRIHAEIDAEGLRLRGPEHDPYLWHRQRAKLELKGDLAEKAAQRRRQLIEGNVSAEKSIPFSDWIKLYRASR